MLSDFAEKNETFLTLKPGFFKVQKIAFFQNGIIQALDQKMPNSSLFTFGHNKTRYKA